MIEITGGQLFVIVSFFAGTCISLIVYIYRMQTKRISAVEKAQNDCPGQISKIYAILRETQTDISWIKKAIIKK